MGLENTLLVALGILNTTAMTLAISSSLVMKSTKRGHRIYLMIVFTGLIVLSCTSGKCVFLFAILENVHK